MYVRRDIEPKIIWHFSWKPLILFTLLSSFVYILYTQFKLVFIALPFLPVATIGTAVAFYVGFKNNASYERLWEARKIWAEIEHLSRFWAMLVLRTSDGKIQDQNQNQNQDQDQDQEQVLRRELVYRQIAWINSLRLQLRNRKMFFDEEKDKLSHVKLVNNQTSNSNFALEISDTLTTFTSEQECLRLRDKRNVASELLYSQLRALEGLQESVPEPDYAKMLDTISDCSQQQAAAERIGSFPFPRQYAYMSTLFVNIFIILLPFSLIGELFKNDAAMAWLTIPFSVLVAWVFHTMEKVGDTSENPFENGLNDVPMTAICREVEIDLKGMLGEQDLPTKILSVDYILL